MKSCLVWLRDFGGLLAVLGILPVIAYEVAAAPVDRRFSVNPLEFAWFLIVYLGIAFQLKSVSVKFLLYGALLGLCGLETASVASGGAIGFLLGLMCDVDRAARQKRRRGPHFQGITGSLSKPLNSGEVEDPVSRTSLPSIGIRDS